MPCVDYALWYDQPIVVFDVETTGVDPDEGDRVVEVGVARFERGICVGRWGGIVNPQRQIPLEAAQVHGITNEVAGKAPPFTSVLPQVLRLARHAHPMAYNAKFDKRFLLSEMHRLSVELTSVPMFDQSVRWIDPLVWVRCTSSLYGNKLGDVCARWDITMDQAHRAASDADATGRLLFAMKEQQKLPSVTMCELLRQQEKYAEAQQADIDAWLARKKAREARRPQ